MIISSITKKLTIVFLMLWSFIGGYEFAKKRYIKTAEEALTQTAKCVDKLSSIIESSGIKHSRPIRIAKEK